MDEPQKIKRFYKVVSVEAVDDRFGVLLDGRAAKTPSRTALTAPTHALAAAIAEEWDAQEKFIDRHSMKLTALLFAAYADDDVAERAVGNVLQYLGTDLLYYRASSPESLVARQTEIWDPYLDWFEKEFGVGLKMTEGVGAIEQSPECAAAVERILADASPEALTGLSTATAITGSAVLALAQFKATFGDEEIFAAARLDEQFQAEKWGVDAEAKARENAMREEFLTVGRFFRLLEAE
ncbi:MAG: ATPase [Marinicaulis sp.]|nr:ATPase [Marinicaulis sp.]NNL88720.1 ATPase [Marinicaulis sp.]